MFLNKISDKFLFAPLVLSSLMCSLLLKDLDFNFHSMYGYAWV